MRIIVCSHRATNITRGLLGFALVTITCSLIGPTTRVSTTVPYLAPLSRELSLVLLVIGVLAAFIGWIRLQQLMIEQRVHAEVAHLDASYTLLRHVDIGKEHADYVMVGPLGVFAIVVLPPKRQYRIVDGSWEERRLFGGWRRLSQSPSDRSRSQAEQLVECLVERGVLDTQITPIVVTADPRTRVEGGEHLTPPVLPLRHFLPYIARTQGLSLLTPTQCGRIVAALSGARDVSRSVV